ncbi:MAG TPA: hypothetical protein GXZ82_15085 [Firmicutes bacterium]|jgi:hypothetical protein|nr:hypothetical protein [Bacillota bacterium]
MNSQAVGEFVRSVSGFGPVRAKTLRNGKEIRLLQATINTSADIMRIQSDTDFIEVDLNKIEHISYSPEKQKYFVHLQDGFVEVRPDI